MRKNRTRSSRNHSRREFLGAAAGALSGIACPAILVADESDRGKPSSRLERYGVGAIGMRYQGTVIAEQTLPFGDVVAICDVDRLHAETARAKLDRKAELHEDYRALIDRKDVDVVTIGTPDHWHTAMAVAACKAGKDVYCEKPLTLTIEEGKLLSKAVHQTGRVVQVGTWQRSDWRFRLACEMARAGLLGTLKRVKVTLANNPQGGPFEITTPPAHFNWDLWQGQTPAVPYCKERTHFTFRWWYEYSGGQITDWGAHHVDIAQWGMGVDRSGPVEIHTEAEFPDVPNGYNVAKRFHARLVYEAGVEMEISDTGAASVAFEGQKGSITVTRGGIRSTPEGLLDEERIPREKYRLYERDDRSRPLRTGKHEATMNHMGNFFDCLKTREAPISDVVSQHRSVSACHLANISMRLGRSLRWDPEKERFIGDAEADGWLSREQRKGYEIKV